jgi:signal transduction histidine kinase
MHMRRIPIRMKLAAALAVPLIGLFFITVVEVAETAADVDDVRAQTALARASVGPSGVITGIQNERTWAVVEMIGQENAVQAPVEGYDESRRLTDEAISAFRETLQGGSEAAADAYAQALGTLDGLDELRATIDANTAPRDLANVGAANEAYQEYFALIRPFLDANSRVALAIDDAELRQATSLVDITTRQLETLSELARSSILEITLGGGLDKPSEIASIARLRSTFDAGNKRLVEAPPPFDAVVGPEYPSGLVEGFTGELDKALTGEPPDMASLLATLNVPRDEGYIGVRNALVDALNDRADELNAAAERREQIYIAMAIVTLVVAIGLTWAVSRSITRPLRALTRQAKDMADHRLPDAVTDILETPLGENITVPGVDPVRIRTRDEVSDVADALNTVQDTALDLAVEQAVLRRNIADSFVNLGRRNQNLLGRQLDFITELESNETNADTLANLFRLDHLATRMRRNAESLLVLAGIEPPRQWAAPVRLTDVIRAALGEVENYRRVAVRGVEPATIIGSAAADLAHLVAELVENALVFSPPDRSVDIRGRNRDDGGYTLAVIDTGLGMAANDVAAANRRLAGAESFTVAPSKYLGHYVAGNLAARHDIHVRLDTSPGQGITATLTLPPSLLTTDRVTSAPVTPPHGHRAVRASMAPPPAALPPAPAPPPPPPPPPAPPSPLYGTPAVAAPWDPPPPTRPVAPAADAPPGPAFPAMPATPMAMPPAPAPAPAPAPYTAPPQAPAAQAAPGIPPVPGGARPPSPPGGLWPRQPTHPSGPRIVGRPRPTASEVTGELPRTAGGLARRAPTSQRPPAARLDDQTLLQALGRYASTPPANAPAPPAAPTPFPAERGASPLTPPDALARRVPGAQLPDAHVVSLRGGGPSAASRPAVDPRPTPAGGASKATDVQTLLSSFTAGVQRGLEEARLRAERATVDAGPNGWHTGG